MACFNPARDLGPRLFSSVAGGGSVPFTANGSGWLTVYLLAPMLGGLLGGGLYRICLRPAYEAEVERAGRAASRVSGQPVAPAAGLAANGSRAA